MTSVALPDLIPPSTVIPPGTPLPGVGPTTATPVQPASTPAPAEPVAPTEPAADAKPIVGAPERYELTAPKNMPEGYALDTVVLESFEKTARALNLPNAAAQQIVDAVLPAIQQRGEAEHQAVIASWKSQIQADPEIGGSKWGETQTHIALARDKLGTPALTAMLEHGLGNHPELARLFARVGKLLAQDSKLVTGSQAAAPDYGNPDQMAAKLFPNTPRVL